MNRTILNLLIDICTAALFLLMAATGYLLCFPMPPGTNKTVELWGLTRHQWGSIHAWISLGLIALLLVHVTLHWNWIASVVGKQFRASKAKPNLIRSGLTVFSIIAGALALFAWTAHLEVRPIADDIPGVCAQEDLPSSDAFIAAPQSSGDDLRGDFWTDVYPVLAQNCSSCHGPSRQMAGFRVDRAGDYFRSGDKGPLVTPGDSAQSRLVDIVSGRRPEMKFAQRHILSQRQIEILMNWIDAGADWPVPAKSQK